MWFKMGNSQVQGDALVETTSVPQIDGAPVIADSGLGGGQTLADGMPQRPVIDTAQTITDVRAASGMDQFIQPQIQPDANGNAVVGETFVAPRQQDPVVPAGDTVTREPMIGAGPDGGMGTVGVPAGHVDEVVNPENTITYEPVISTDNNGQLEQGLSIGMPGGHVDTTVPLEDRKSKPLWAGGRRPSGAVVAPATDSAVSDGDRLDRVAVENTITPTSEGETNPPAEVDVNPNIGVGIPPQGETYPGMQPSTPNVWEKPDAGQPIANPNPDAGLAVPAPKEPSQQELDSQADRKEDEDLRTQIANEPLGPVDTLVSPNAGDRIEPSNTDAREDVLHDNAVDALRDQGVITTKEGSEVIDSTGGAVQPDSAIDESATGVLGTEAQKVADEVVDQVMGGSGDLKEAQQDEIVANEVGTSDDTGSADSHMEDVVVEGPVQEASADSGADGSGDDSSIDPEEPTMTGGGDENSEPGDQGSGASETPGAVVKSNPPNVELQERADELATLSLRDLISELGNTDVSERDALINRVASAVVYKQLESEGIANAVDVKDPKGVWGRISGMSALYRLWVKENQGKISSDEKTVQLDNVDSDVVTFPADDQQAA